MQTLRLHYLVPDSKAVQKLNLLGNFWYVLCLADGLQCLNMCTHIVCAKGFLAEGILGHKVISLFLLHTCIQYTTWKHRGTIALKVLGLLSSQGRNSLLQAPCSSFKSSLLPFIKIINCKCICSAI